MFKKFLVMAMTVIALGTFMTMPAFADEGRQVNASLKPNSALDGSDNNRYYHLTPGSCSINVTQFSGWKSNVDILLKRARTGPDKTIDSVRVSHTGWYQFNGVDQNSYDYYLYLMSHGPSSVKLKAYMHDHHK